MSSDNTVKLIQMVVAREGLSEGDSVRVDHDGCPAGGDTKKRLWVVASDHYASGYCHHCGGSWRTYKSGVPNKSAVLTNLRRVRKEGLKGGKGVSLPSDFVSSKVPLEAQAILNKANIPPHIAIMNNIGYSARARRLVIPTLDENCDKFSFIQYKRLMSDDEGPKYYNVSGLKKTEVCSIYVRGKQTKSSPVTTLVLTEDVLSAIRGSCVSSVVYMPLFGVSISDAQVSYLLRRMPHLQYIVLALDNDNPTVQWKTTQIFLKLRRMYSVANLYLGRDLKEMTPHDIRSAIYSTIISLGGPNYGE